MTDRGLQTFVEQAGRNPADLSLLAGDASPRKYYRLPESGGEPAAVVMDSSRELPSIGPFVDVTRWLCAQGFAAPEILADDLSGGYLLLEDLGDDLLARLLVHPDAAATAEQDYYTAAIDMLVVLAAQKVPDFIPAYDDVLLNREVDLFTEWYLPSMDIVLSGEDMAEWRDIWTDLHRRSRIGAPVMTLRDVHAENLIWLPDRDGVARVGLLDYQDAVAGPVTYDLISLLQDARRDVTPALRDAMMERFAQKTGINPDVLHEAAEIMAAQRNVKIIGIFIRLWQRDGKQDYLAYLPRMWRLLERNLTHPANARLRDFMHRILPMDSAVDARCPTVEVATK